eukprot:gb/GECG01011404.1/.p1 GENE.gb/GECG01011404.1/~~gb/GECG01011404.1/.p1  ORF type:complete len:1434 (+),score=250.95 gb/GECG01011404.1/:1-4302(+)
MTRRGLGSKENPDRIEKYAMGQELGRGGFGVVYLALDTMTGKSVAVKRLSLQSMNEEDIEITQGEIELLKKLRHPNIVEYVDSVRTQDYLYIALEYVENGSLTGLVKKFGTFNETLSAMYTAQVLQGLSFLHEQGVIHRDIKGENILTTKEGFVKLADFGVAIQGVDHEHDVVGTPYWMAPEVIEMAGTSSACDIWSVGCTIIEMLTGKPPYFDYNPMTALFRIVQDEYPPFPEQISPALRDFLIQCFKKEPSFRKSAQELLSHPWIVNTVKSKALSSGKQQVSESAGDGTEKIMEKAASVIEQARASNEKLKDKQNLSSLFGNATADAFGDDDDDDTALLQLQKDIQRGNINVRQSRQGRYEGNSAHGQQRHNFHTIGLKDVEEFEKINQNLFENTLRGMVLRGKQQQDEPLGHDENANSGGPKLFKLEDVTPQDINEWAGKVGKASHKNNAQPIKLPAINEDNSFDFEEEFDLGDDDEQEPNMGTSKVQGNGSDHAQKSLQAFTEEDSDEDWDVDLKKTDKTDNRETRHNRTAHNSLKEKLSGKPALQAFADSDEEEDWDKAINSRLEDEPTPKGNDQLSGLLGKKPNLDVVFGKDDDDQEENWDSLVRPQSKSSGKEPTPRTEKSGLAQFQEDDEDEAAVEIEYPRKASSNSNKETSLLSPPDYSKESLKDKLARKQRSAPTKEHAWEEDQQPSSRDVVLDIDAALEEEGGESEILSDAKETSITARRQNSVLSILDKLQSSAQVSSEIILKSCKTLRSLFRESPALKQFFVKRHGVLPLLELLQTWKSTEDFFVICTLLSTMNHLVFNEPGLHESLALIGVTPSVMAFANSGFPPRVRQEAAKFVNQCCTNSRLTLQLFVAAGGASVLVELLKASVKGRRSQIHEDESSEDAASDVTTLDMDESSERSKGEMDQLLLRHAINGIVTVLNMQTVAMTQNEFRRLFIRTGILAPLVMALRASFYFVCNSLSGATLAEHTDESDPKSLHPNHKRSQWDETIDFTPDDFRRGVVPKTMLPSSPFLDTDMFVGESTDSKNTTIEQMNRRRSSMDTRGMRAALGEISDEDSDDDWKPFGMKDLTFSQPKNADPPHQSAPHHSRSRSEQVARPPSKEQMKPARNSTGNAGEYTIKAHELPICGTIKDVLGDMSSLMNLLVLLAQGDSVVKAAYNRKDLVKVLLFILRPAPYSLLNHELYAPIVYSSLKTIRHMSMEPSVVERMGDSGAISTLVPLLCEDSELDVLSEDSSHRYSKEVRHFVLHALFNLCRVNNQRRENAAMNGIIPPLQKLLQKQNSLQPLALPILCDLAHAGPTSRKILWRHNGVGMYIGILKRNYWAMHALNSLAVWLGKDPERVEVALTEKSHVDALVDMFTSAPRSYFETIVGHIESMLDRSPLLAKHMSFSFKFIEDIMTRLKKKNSVCLVKSYCHFLTKY